MPHRNVGVGVAAEAQARRGTHLRTEERDVVVIGVEDAGHGATTETDGIAQVGGVDVKQFRHGALRPSRGEPDAGMSVAAQGEFREAASGRRTGERGRSDHCRRACAGRVDPAAA